MTHSLLVGTVTLSPTEQALSLALSAVCAIACYVVARRTQQVLGVPPWRIPPFVWALIGGFLSVFGLLIETAARFTTRAAVPPSPTDFRHLSAPPPQPPTGTGMWPPPGAPWGSAPPPSPETAVTGLAPPTDAPPGLTPEFPLPVQPGLPGPDGWRPSPLGQQGPPPLFGWYPDPTGRHEHRYWDGRMWSDKVSDGGERSEDPLPV